LPGHRSNDLAWRDPFPKFHLKPVKLAIKGRGDFAAIALVLGLGLGSEGRSLLSAEHGTAGVDTSHSEIKLGEGIFGLKSGGFRLVERAGANRPRIHRPAESIGFSGHRFELGGQTRPTVTKALRFFFKVPYGRFSRLHGGFGGSQACFERSRIDAKQGLSVLHRIAIVKVGPPHHRTRDFRALFDAIQRSNPSKRRGLPRNENLREWVDLQGDRWHFHDGF